MMKQSKCDLTHKFINRDTLHIITKVKVNFRKKKQRSSLIRPY